MVAYAYATHGLVLETDEHETMRRDSSFKLPRRPRSWAGVDLRQRGAYGAPVLAYRSSHSSEELVRNMQKVTTSLFSTLHLEQLVTGFWLSVAHSPKFTAQMK